MFFGRYIKREEYELLKLRFNLTKSYAAISKSKADFFDYFVSYTTKENELLLDIYVQNDMYFGIFLKYSHSEVFSDTIYLKTRSPSAIDTICSSDASLCTNIIFLNNIDTNKKYERNGHASKQLLSYVKIAHKLGKKEIRGNLWISTPIGVDKLKHFYNKNGFITGNDYFFKILDSKGV